MTDNHDLAEFEKSLSTFRDYPLNLTRAADFSYTLVAYNSKLVQGQEVYFEDSQPRIRIWDLIKPQDGSHIITSTIDLVQLQNALSEISTDPARRFIFIKAGSHRSPLDCTREMMAYLFTHHQIMAHFLDLWCTFTYRETPHRFACFQNEDYLSSQHHQPGLSAMGRSGIRIQHCFNLLGIERSRDKRGWDLRQTAAYHSYDLIEGRTLWVILKGDNIMRRRLEYETEESVKKENTSLNSVHGSFAQTLTDHVLITQWCAENWESYVERLEAKYRSISELADHAPVDDMVEDMAIIKQPDLPPGQQARGPTKSPEPPGFVRRLARRDAGFGTQVEPPRRRVEHHRIEDLVQFDTFQSLSHLDKTLGEASFTITQNRRVLAQIKEYYRELVKSAGFKAHVPDKSTLKACEEATSEFAMKIGMLEDNLARYEGYLKTLLNGVGRTYMMYNSIVQYQDMRTGKYLAESSEKHSSFPRDPV